MDQLDAEEGSESGDGDDDEDEDDEEEMWSSISTTASGLLQLSWRRCKLGMRKFSARTRRSSSATRNVRGGSSTTSSFRAGKSNGETFQELSLDEVQLVYKKFKSHLVAIFMYYGREQSPFLAS